MANNMFQEQITPDKPKILQQERIFVYVPKATTTTQGIASFDNTDFRLNNGKVYFKRNDPRVVASLIKILADPSQGGLEYTDDNIVKVQIKTINGQSLLGSGNIVIDSVIGVTKHNADPDAHPVIQEKISNLQDEVDTQDTNLQNQITANAAATQTELNKKVDKTTTTDVSVNKIVNSGSYPYGIGILSSDKTDVNGIYSSVGVDKDKILLISAKTGASSNLTFTPDKLELIQSNSNAGTYLRSNVATENYVDTSIQNAISGAVIYKGIWTTTAETTNYSALNSFRPIKSGWRWEVGGTGCSIDNVQYLPTDFITFNQDCGEDTTITTAMIDKTDNTDSVTSVNGQVGNVVLSASDIGATTQSYVDTQDTNLQTQITANATDINEKEDKSNKVISLSSASTDTQYPSAKCVYDIVGNIVSLMEVL